MSARLAVVLPRFGAIVVGCLLASAAVTLAAGGGSAPAQPQSAPVAASSDLVVPDVTKQAYVFAKGTLEDAGFAWKVVGPVKGYAANVVVSQSPAGGTKLVDTGTPTITLQLSRNKAYGEKGDPENASPYAGTPLELARLATAPAAAPQAAAPTSEATAPPAAKPAPAAKKSKRLPSKRPAAFAVPGAPKEPLDELPLDARAEKLARWLEAHPNPTPANVNHWLYQHQWIVTGARFGWWRGAEALEILVRVDKRVEELWGVGTRSRQLAERTLAEVSARAAA